MIVFFWLQTETTNYLTTMLHKVLILTSKHTHTTWLRETPMTDTWVTCMSTGGKQGFFLFWRLLLYTWVSLSRCSSSLVLRLALAAPQKPSEVHGLCLKYASTAGRIAKTIFRPQVNKEENLNALDSPAYSWGSMGRSMTLCNAAIQSFWSSSVSQANRNFLSGVPMVIPNGQWWPWTLWGRPGSTV